MKPYRVQGTKIEVLRWRLDYTDAEGNAAYQLEVDEESARRLQSALAYEGCGGFSLTQQDAQDAAWMDGLDISRHTDPMAEADRIYTMGQEAYESEQNALSVEQQLMITQLQQQTAIDALIVAQLGGGGSV